MKLLGLFMGLFTCLNITNINEQEACIDYNLSLIDEYVINLDYNQYNNEY